MPLTLETATVGALELDPDNARKHGTRNLDAIAGEPSAVRPAPAARLPARRRAGHGHRRQRDARGARSLGWTEVVITVVPDDWTAEQAKAYALADNRTAELATWDEAVLAEQLGDLDALGFDLNRIGFDGLPALDLPRGADDVGEVPLDPVELAGRPVALRRAPRHLRIRAPTPPPWAGCSATTAARRSSPTRRTASPTSTRWTRRCAIRARSRRSIARSPATTPPTRCSRRWSRTRSTLACAHAAQGAGCYVFHADSKRLLFEASMARAGFLVHQTLVWVKQRITLGHMDYLSQHEPVLYGWKQGGKHGWYGGRRRSALVADEAPDLDA